VGSGRTVDSVRATKDVAGGERVSFRAKVLRLWEVGGRRMCLVGDASGLTRVELGGAAVEDGRSYEFRDATVRQHPGGWTSSSIVEGGTAAAIDEDIETAQDEDYIERTFKILSGIQRKKGRREGRPPAWKHPSQPEEAEQ